MQHLQVIVVYCAEDQQYCILVPWIEGMTVLQAIQQSKIAQYVMLPEPLQVGIFGLKVKSLETQTIQSGDRVEIYRPLKMSPKEVRRQRAEQHPVGRFQPGNQWQKKHQ
ncbi:RnfH family protein [Acinetobacter qingfengensis]|uniref:UPF0125 protein BJI46_08380 n=1 Tax=Acinetobacter qingfengensis TaxID=1262585 RepID=A0A1E7REK4_9GAMM|nr:RnfH family protein [Acinetobacter qingfengensis]KAA8735039.1 RnfH family protein [Acinetobacter qingfengensis]OEY97761.1 hypothetical protein BJI46_08380 [Acinetobacter qingfengensis]